MAWCNVRIQDTTQIRIKNAIERRSPAFGKHVPAYEIIEEALLLLEEKDDKRAAIHAVEMADARAARTLQEASGSIPAVQLAYGDIEDIEDPDDLF